MRGDTGISSEHFLYNENNLTHCSTQRNSPPIPQSSPPPPPLHYHIKAWVQSKSSLSRVGARHTEGGGRGRDQGSESRPKPEFAFILLRCVYVQKTQCVCMSVDTSSCLLVEGGKNTAEKSVQQLEYQLGFLPTLKRSQFKFQRQHIMRPAGGLTEQQRNAKAGTWCSKEGITWQMASTEPKSSLSHSIAFLITRLLLNYHQTVCFSASLTV